jgi:hypothetical protein
MRYSTPGSDKLLPGVFFVPAVGKVPRLRKGLTKLSQIKRLFYFVSTDIIIKQLFQSSA